MSEWRPLAGPLAAWSTGRGPRLVFVHGFTQTSASWKPVAGVIAAAGFESVVVDAPGHGGSAGVVADMPTAAATLAEQCGAAVYVGYSMGGRLCLHVAVHDQRLVRGLGLLGTSPGIADADERAARRVADERLAERIESVGVGAFLDEWLAQPLFAGLRIHDHQRRERLGNTPAGLAASLRNAGTGAQASLWERLPELAMPVLVMAGDADEKFSVIGRRVAAAVSHGQFAAIAGAGHAAHLQQPGAVVGALLQWLGPLPR
jgi:2-succinyl-6-hydroxy-2,4-cyclohexadiene-1-carboxylate synthase